LTLRRNGAGTISGDFDAGGKRDVLGGRVIWLAPVPRAG
jgi:hypothetical protein